MFTRVFVDSTLKKSLLLLRLLGKNTGFYSKGLKLALEQKDRLRVPEPVRSGASISKNMSLTC